MNGTNIVHQQGSELIHPYIGHPLGGNYLLPERHTLINCKQQVLGGEGIDGDDQFIKKLCCSPCDFQIAIGKWIEALRIHGYALMFFLVLPPYALLISKI